MHELMMQIQEYFNCHLQRKFWQKLSENDQKAAVKNAERDIMLSLGTDTLDMGDLLGFCAVCEQALYLAMLNADYITRGNLKSETIEGIGKREYFERKSSFNEFLSPRSELFLSRLPGYGTNQLSRG